MDQTKQEWQDKLLSKHNEAVELEQLGEDGSVFLSIYLTPAELTSLYLMKSTDKGILGDAMKIQQKELRA